MVKVTVSSVLVAGGAAVIGVVFRLACQIATVPAIARAVEAKMASR
jgi:hypothetical protein